MNATQTAEHTPTPWTAEYVNGDIAILGPNIHSAASEGVDSLQMVTRMDPNHISNGNIKANAAHIVKCVNERAELLRALEGLMLVAVGKDYVNQAKDKVTGEGLYDFAQRLLRESRTA